MATRLRRIVRVFLLFNAMWLPAAALADEPAHTKPARTKVEESDPDRALKQQMAEDLRRARLADQEREALREQRIRESEEREREMRERATLALAPPRESAESKRARAQRQVEAREEVRAADRERIRERAAARRQRARRDAH